MDKRLIFFVFICIQQTGYLHAQWTKEDSAWLDDVVSGKKAIKINPEFLKAIENGTLINTDKPMMEPLAAPPILPISKDFDIQPTDTTEGKSIDYSKMPPAVFALYKNELNLGPDTGKILKDGAFAMPDLRDKNRLQVPNTPVSVAAQATNIYNEEVKDGQKRGGFVFSTRLTFSLNDILMGIFNKTERNKRRNRKKANAWKQYKDYPEHLEWKPKERQ
ncbi:hypothetical protein M2459_001109 [Parabacteroides sp. PF5-5]|uniref:hypothetical protein n=1 Tax=unclassified Parabacteroides TaxID=2649774 RepID=UPI00247655EC|nr:MULTISPECIES: hypothetical protein [unclassified Parabacteroides]MDH6304376.1 hypothetical protein [Parabacteroides sp. PH5-39]MDH6315471.1 hypothetical protein [Parabacteroides sp. PF5-13]MDH6319035.1 hypothetical protein [Parabacteroides sp. PH5-13]MDH6322765.1 hypothetical protein [Parabacteroides sp. PH5-8]MDH6326663.1 hypothetical protein [Parabacteroides sp. PH5-41]